MRKEQAPRSLLQGPSQLSLRALNVPWVSMPHVPTTTTNQFDIQIDHPCERGIINHGISDEMIFQLNDES